ncbi:MAG: hypothetical protein GYB33_17775 [Gammaproteobacteria bacterium]|nr:hypothetical protein [Gammaproteobacteria bacterium]
MNITCDCGAFVARLKSFPKHTPGRLVCYCDDCQAYVKKIKCSDVLDDYGGTEVIPAYPKEVEIVQGLDQLKCYRLSEHGTYRWATSCCNSPILNTRPGFPWAGILHTAYTRRNPTALSVLGEIKCRIYGKYALPGAPFRISNTIGLRDMLVVMPFILKGKILGMGKESPFFGPDNSTPLCVPELLP